MANDKKFVPKNGLRTQNISFVDADPAVNEILVRMINTDTLSFTGESGQLFSITDSLSGTIFAVNDISGTPSIEVDDDGTIRLAELFGNILIGTNVDDGITKVQIDGSISSKIIKQPQGAVSASTASTALDFDQYGNFYVTMTSNTTFSFSNLSNNIGSSGYIFIKQDVTGGRTFTLPSEAKTPKGQAIAQETASNSLSLITYYVVDVNTVIVNYIGDFK